VPASESNPAAIHTDITTQALPTLQVMTRVFRNTPAPIMFETLMEIAAHIPTPRIS
jgi:hypothetical protein